ncbi:unnamed protein product [Rotaria socialis]|uniref:Nuclear receptor domain-containing protein n=1 Tax=Rotaria socialis TaxID=392032 RepID=A0A820M3I7_9BILA|nr:unnamed protein product [Rotaria socialis]CAF4367658.1 unnamed protein product [Rotaria socialis]
MASSGEPNEATTQPNQPNNICQICGDSASINNYGALSCSPCRTFFRRNAFPPENAVVCRYGGNCEVNMLTRKVCAACRLGKCFLVGMSVDLIRKEDLARKKRKRKTSKGEEPTTATIPQESALDLPSRSNSCDLSFSDWTIISNVVHAFNTFSPVAEIRRRILFFNTTESNLQYNLTQARHLMSSFYNGLQSFISSTPDFKILTLREQHSLFQRNMVGVLCVGGTYLMHESGILDKPEHESVILSLYGSEFIQQVKLIWQQLHCDPILIKLILVALAFSSNYFMIDNHGNTADDTLLLGTFRLLGSQNVYVEIIWKYLLSTYGHNNAVLRFSILIKQLLTMLSYSIYMYKNNIIHQAFIDDIIKQTATESKVDGNALVPLWGKKN